MLLWVMDPSKPFSTSKLREGIRDIGLQEVQIAVPGDEDERGC